MLLSNLHYWILPTYHLIRAACVKIQTSGLQCFVVSCFAGLCYGKHKRV